ncbi:5'-methylthioadenosine/S-adenosylhomocysteine nucleosidase family protein [Streptomyces sp. IBSNAI002]|uniref:5'-methylthioadenosine/S-adenosylhomocysteine nucleosidase family protein n=1 Tax=Streptomyces sp. IBSNAI002 TaxID=3457500 RepID=UPI003FD23A04
MAEPTTADRELKPKVGLVVALGEEFRYVMAGLDRLGDIEVDQRVYYRFRVPGSDVMGVLTVLDAMGLPNAAVAVNDLVHEFKVSLVALVGTAAALDDGLPLGDVVIASEIVDYLNQAKVVDDPKNPDGAAYRLAGTNWKPSAALLRYVQNFPRREATEERAEQWTRDSHAACRIAKPDRPDQGPQYHVAPIASGDMVIGSQAFREVLQDHNRKLAAVEMEAGGAALAAYPQDDVDLIVVRGLSDRAESGKAATDATRDLDGLPNAWRRYAVGNAIRLLTLMLADPDFPWLTRHEPARRRRLRGDAGSARTSGDGRPGGKLRPTLGVAAGLTAAAYGLGLRVAEHLAREHASATQDQPTPAVHGSRDHGDQAAHKEHGDQGDPDRTADTTTPDQADAHTAPHHPGDSTSPVDLMGAVGFKDVGGSFDAGLV